MGGSTPSQAPSLGSGYDRNIMRAMRMSQSGSVDALLNSAPELRSVDIRALQSMARDESLINALNSREVEGKVSPDLLRIRDELPAQIADDLEGGPSQRLSNQWLKQGLSDAIATGADTDSGFARSAIADSTRQSYIADRSLQQAKAAAFLGDNPAPVAGLDPGALATASQTAKTANADARDAWKFAVANAIGQGGSAYMGAVQQAGQMSAGRATDLSASINAARGQNQAFWGQMAGAGASAVGSAAGAYAGNSGQPAQGGFGTGVTTGSQWGNAGAAALTGAASGAVLGSVVPGYGTAIGAVVGGLAGGITGYLS